jgi:ferredoxin-NADP reductase
MPKSLSGILGSVLEVALTPHPVDRYLELFDPRITWSDLRAEVLRVDRRSPRSVTLTLKPTRQWSGFEPGQFVQLSTVINGVRHSRCYSPASSATRRDVIELTLTAHDDGFVSKHLRDNARAGQVLGLQPASGTFTMPAQRPASMLFISGGSGITPVLSMLRTLVDEKHQGLVTFVHYARSPQDNPYAAELESIATARPDWKITTHFTRSDDGSSRTYFSADHLADVDMTTTEVFLCGPPALHESVSAHLSQIGAEERLHTEQFVLVTPAADDGAPAHGRLQFAGSNKETDNDGSSILEQAENTGLSPEFGCRMGICFSCSAVKKSGLTKNILTGETDSETDKHIQLCISAPVGDCVIDI